MKPKLVTDKRDKCRKACSSPRLLFISSLGNAN